MIDLPIVFIRQVKPDVFRISLGDENCDFASEREAQAFLDGINWYSKTLRREMFPGVKVARKIDA